MIQIDIPMPKGCWTCPYYHGNYGKPKCMSKSRTGRLLDITWNLKDKRQRWCPLIEVIQNG